MAFIKRFFRPPEGSFFLFGPRGTGKSTWLREHYKDAFFIDLLAPESFRAYSARPERLREVVEATPPDKVIVIDEIQKVPQLLDVVHQQIEKCKERIFILTGSSARKLKRSGIDLLAGRAIVRTMHPFMAAELGQNFSLDNSLSLGMLPLVIDSPSPSETLDSYVAVYLKEEVQAESIVRSVATFSRFVESASLSHGCILNISQMARECEVKRKTAEAYTSILEDLLLAFRIPVFAKRVKRHLSSHPKFYFFDAGVFRSARPLGPLDSPQELAGVALEGLVAQHLRAWIAYSGKKCSLYFWRTKSGREVDFVVYGDDTFVALEVKNSDKIHPKTLSGLQAFRRDYPEAKTLLLYRGREKMNIKGITCTPIEEFLLKLVPWQQIDC